MIHKPIVLILGPVTFVFALKSKRRRRRRRPPHQAVRLVVTFGSPDPRSTPYTDEAPHMDTPAQVPPPPLPVSFQLSAQLAAYDASGNPVTPTSPIWSSSDQSTFTVSHADALDALAAQLLGVKEGSANLLVSASGISISIPVTVAPGTVVGQPAASLVVTFGTPTAPLPPPPV